MLEVEVKYPAESFDAIRVHLTNWGATLIGVREDVDTYFNSTDPHRNFAHSDEALRVRSIGDSAFITYKGPRIDTLTKSRLEIEVPLASEPGAAELMGQLLGKLGFNPSGQVHKSREVYEFGRDGFTLTISLDDVTHVGRYVEVETIVEQAQLEQARTLVLATAAEMGLTNQERRSCVQLALAVGSGGVHP